MIRRTPDPEPGSADGLAQERLDLRLAAPGAAAWIACAALLGSRPALIWSIAVVAGGTALAAAVRGGMGGRTGAALNLAAIALVLVSLALQRDIRSVGTVEGLAEQGATVTVRADVASDPMVSLAHGFGRTSIVIVRLQVHDVIGRGRRSTVDTPVLAVADRSWATLQWGEHVQVRGRLGPAGPGDDVVAALEGQGGPVVLGQPGPIRRAAAHVRAGLRQAVRGTPSQGAGLLPGLVLGDTSGLDPAVQDAMRASGLTHLVAVSGSNVAIVCGAVLLLARRAGLPRRLRPPSAALALAGFVVLARPEPSVLRAAVMGGIALIGMASARRSAGLPPLAGAVIALLVVDPWLARSYGFALSTLATAGLLLFARSWADRLARVMPRSLALALAVPLAAQAACGPVIVLLQGSVSIVSVPANLVVAPLVAPATVAGVAAALLGTCWPWAAHLVAWLGVLPAEGIARCAGLAQHAPVLPWPGGARGAIALALLTMLGIGFGRSVVRSCRRHPWLATGLTGAVVVAMLPGPIRGWPPPGWVMVMCDVGQGDGLVLNVAPGRAIVVDTGPDPTLMDRCLRRLGVRTVDLLVLTHDHADHIEGVPGVLRDRRVRMLLRNGLDDPPEEAARLRRWVAAAHLPSTIARVGETGVDGAVSWQVLWPAEFIDEDSVPNNASIVLMVRARGLRLLLLGDVETPAARRVAQALEQLPAGAHADVLKVAHHGSARQDPGLIREVGAPLALISVGAGNPYGHPAASTLALLNASGAAVHRTDLDGDIAVTEVSGRPAVTTLAR